MQNMNVAKTHAKTDMLQNIDCTCLQCPNLMADICLWLCARQEPSATLKLPQNLQSDLSFQLSAYFGVLRDLAVDLQASGCCFNNCHEAAEAP